MEKKRYLTRGVTCYCHDGSVELYGLCMLTIEGKEVAITPFEKEVPGVTALDNEVTIKLDFNGRIVEICGIEGK